MILAIAIGAICYTLLREAFFLYTTHKLINKVMSQSYWDYERAKHLKNEQREPDRTPETIDPLEQFRHLEEF